MSYRSRPQILASLAELGFEVEAAPAVHGSYRPAVSANGFVFTSGQIPVVDGVARFLGKVGEDLPAPVASEAAALCAAAAIRVAAHLADEDRSLVPVKVTVFIAAAPGFTTLPVVADGASEVMSAVFGEVPARSAVGVAELPLGVPVEVEAVFAVGPGV